ncbi:hypothetical protein DFH09DRAFT_1373076 [Mycena vulgaris]|nr:hypothetical protein DFH09DRAFT_1373076 [Mycena vulgaris]
MQRTTRSTTRKTRSQSNNVPTDQQTNLRATKPKVMPKTKPKSPTRSKAASKRRVDEETEGNADTDVDDGDGIRDSVDEDTANVGENASKSEKIPDDVAHAQLQNGTNTEKTPDDVADAQLQNGTNTEKTPDDVADAQLQNGTSNEKTPKNHPQHPERPRPRPRARTTTVGDTNELLTDLAHDPFNLSRRSLGRTWRHGNAPLINHGDEQEFAREEEQHAAATEEQWDDPESEEEHDQLDQQLDEDDDMDVPYSDCMYRFPDMETMLYDEVDDEEDDPYFDLNDFPSPVPLASPWIPRITFSPPLCLTFPAWTPATRLVIAPPQPLRGLFPFTPFHLAFPSWAPATRFGFVTAPPQPLCVLIPCPALAFSTALALPTPLSVSWPETLPSSALRRVTLPDAESDLSHPSDDFEVGQAAEEKTRTWKKSRGMPVAPAVEELDQEDEEEFEKEVAQRGFDNSPAATKRSKKSRKSKAKETTATTQMETEAAVETGKGGRKGRGKAKAKAKATQPTSGFQSDDCLVDGDEVEEEEDGNSDGKGYTRGPIPDDIKELLYLAHDEFTAAVDDLAKRCGKSSTTLHEELGTVIRTGRAPSAWNVWQQYFGELIPKDKREANFSKQSRAAFVAACRVGDDFPKELLSDSEAVYERLPWLKGWKANVTENAVAALRDNNKIKAKLKSELKPVTQLAALLLSTYSVHMWGYLIDPDGQASFVFGAGEDFKEMRRLQHHNLNQQVKDQEHIFGTIEMRKRGLEALRIPIPNLDAQDGETTRDAYRRQFTSIVAGQLWEFLRRAGTLSGQDLDKTRFQMRWGVKFIDAAREGKCRIINYPSALRDANQVIGTAAFVLKKIKSATFETFMDQLVNANASTSMTSDDDDIMCLVSWSDEERQLPLDEQGEIPVIIDQEGVVLRRVKHSDGFTSDMKKQAETAEKAVRAAQKEARKGKLPKTRDGREVKGQPRISRAAEDRPDARAGSSRPPQLERPSERNSRARSHSPPHHLESSRWPHPELEPIARPRSPSPRAGASRRYYADPSRPYYAKSDRDSRAMPSHPYYAEPHAGPSRPYYAEPDHDSRAGPAREYGELNRDARRYSPAPHPEASRSYYAKPNSHARSPPPLHAGSSYSYYGETDSHADSRPPLRYGQHSRAGFERPAARAPHSPVNHVTSSHALAPVVEQSTALPRMNFVAREQELTRAAQLKSRTRAPALASGGVGLGGGSKRKALHDGGAETSDRAPKHRRTLDEDNVLIKMRFLVEGQPPGRIFYATRLKRTDHPSRADSYTFVEEAGRWERMSTRHTPVLATEQDSERYNKEITILGLEEYLPQRRA